MRLALLLVPLLLIGCGGGSGSNGTTNGTPPSTNGGGQEPPPVDGNPSREHQLKDLQEVTIKVGGRDIKAWVMDTDSKRREGMMFLTDEEVPDDHAMLFVFPTANPQSFWMDNTIIPLDIAYVGTNMKVLNVQHGKPLDKTGLPSDGPAQYVIEVKGGEGERLGIVKGATVELPEGLKATP